jgi:hypothetical protein
LLPGAAQEGLSVFDALFDLFDRDRRRPSGERRRGLGGLLDRLSGGERDDVRSDRRRTDEWDDDRDDGRRRRRRDEFWDD